MCLECVFLNQGEKITGKFSRFTWVDDALSGKYDLYQ